MNNRLLKLTVWTCRRATVALLALAAAATLIPHLLAADLAPLPIQLPDAGYEGTPKDMPPDTTAEKPSGKPRPPFMAPAGVTNVAFGKPVTSSDNSPISGEVKQITDGKKQAWDENVVLLRKRTQWVQIDLGGENNVYAILVWHEHKTPVVYRDVIVQVSDDPEFKTGVQTLFNNDQDNSSGLGVGTDREYFENYEGKLIDAKGTKARYVRCYSKGNTDHALNGYVEVEVYRPAGQMSRWFPPGLLLIIAVALVFRLPDLDRRPMHNDEGVNAIKFRSLWEKNSYQYDPGEFHGPTLPYATLPSAWLNSSRDFGQFNETVFRLVPVAFGVGLIFLLFLLADGLGKTETLCAGVLTAVSPAMVYYSRYYIHEMLLVFATALVLAAGWRYARTGRLGWCLLIGLGIGLMHATKETFVFAVFALAAAVAGELAWERWIERRAVDFKRYFRWQHISLALLIAMTVSLVLFTSFFSNANGPIDSLKTYLTWIHRAGGDSPHTQPWFFYFRRLLFFHYSKGPYWSEGLILILAAAGTVGALNRRRLATANPALVRTIAFYSILLAGIYTVLPYKTPWCALGFWHGMILLAGVGAMEIVRRCRPGWRRLVVATALVVGTLHLGWQAWQASFVFGASQLNPYVYAHTSPDVLKLVSKIDALSRFSPDGQRTVVKVMSPGNDYWPLPWYLRQFPNVGWWGRVPQDPLAPIMIVASKFEAAFDARPDKTHLMAGYFQLRPQVFFELYVEINLWRDYVKSLPPEKD